MKIIIILHNIETVLFAWEHNMVFSYIKFNNFHSIFSSSHFFRNACYENEVLQQPNNSIFEKKRPLCGKSVFNKLNPAHSLFLSNYLNRNKCYKWNGFQAKAMALWFDLLYIFSYSLLLLHTAPIFHTNEWK